VLVRPEALPLLVRAAAGGGAGGGGSGPRVGAALRALLLLLERLGPLVAASPRPPPGGGGGGGGGADAWQQRCDAVACGLAAARPALAAAADAGGRWAPLARAAGAAIGDLLQARAQAAADSTAPPVAPARPPSTALCAAGRAAAAGRAVRVRGELAAPAPSPASVERQPPRPGPTEAAPSCGSSGGVATMPAAIALMAQGPVSGQSGPTSHAGGRGMIVIGRYELSRLGRPGPGARTAAAATASVARVMG
jgi:hypothetical protein